MTNQTEGNNNDDAGLCWTLYPKLVLLENINGQEALLAPFYVFKKWLSAKNHYPWFMDDPLIEVWKDQKQTFQIPIFKKKNLIQN